MEVGVPVPLDTAMGREHGGLVWVVRRWEDKHAAVEVGPEIRAVKSIRDRWCLERLVHVRFDV
jgi:hypothetical protein